jgi:hypothetical protein
VDLRRFGKQDDGKRYCTCISHGSHRDDGKLCGRQLKYVKTLPI